jgi:F-type H+-transporting ATPase subunit c
MLQTAKVIGTNIAVTGLIGTGIGVVFGTLILDFAFSEATGLFALTLAFLLLYVT